MNFLDISNDEFNNDLMDKVKTFCPGPSLVFLVQSLNFLSCYEIEKRAPIRRNVLWVKSVLWGAG